MRLCVCAFVCVRVRVCVCVCVCVCVATMAHGADWWTLGDTWESTTLFACFSCQFVTSALNFGLGSKYRQPLTGNTALLCACAILYALFSYILLADPDGVVALFHIASIEYNSVQT